MTLEILAFTLAALYGLAVFVALLVGWAELPDPPVSTSCRRCSRWMIDRRHQSFPLCHRCRREVAHTHQMRRDLDLSEIRR
ncbi:hypothetical protein [Nocardia alni]|uniref:hypothetical protein n=1 Tax=Nocardia alni TaxID=2815723 RepID=UPI001C23D419|nr:hypothetical protein [Nocardia alni]